MKKYLPMKRALDIIASLFLMVLLSPLMIIIFLLVALTSPGPVIYKQTRVGYQGAPITIYKFRTMRANAPCLPTWKMDDYSRYITPVGYFLRRSSLDELPQIFNVLAGKMSLIGPRPVIPAEDELVRLRKMNGVYHVYPGITGYAQIMGRDEVSIEQKVKLDKYYVEHLSFALDVKILLLTIKNVLMARGVHEGGVALSESEDANDDTSPEDQICTVRDLRKDDVI